MNQTDQAQALRDMVKSNSVASRPVSRVITVTSGKGGVGKSNTSINLAIQFKKLGQRVVILDADFGLANIEIMFGTVPKHNLRDLIYQNMNIKDVITWGPMEVGFISGGSGIAGMSNLDRSDLTTIIKQLAELDALADIIIVDTGAGISDSVLEFLVASGEILLVTTPEPTSITDAYSLLKALNVHNRFDRDYTQIKVLANKVDSEAEGQSLFNKLNAVVNRYLHLPISYLGSVPQDSQLSKAVMQQTPVSIANPGAKSSLSYEKLAGKLMNMETSTANKRGVAAFFSHIITTAKRSQT